MNNTTQMMHWGNMECVRLDAGGYTALIAPDLGSNVIRLCDVKNGIEFFRFNDSNTYEELLKSAEVWAETLQMAVFPDLRVALVHGRMKSGQKDEIMRAFADGGYDILVATTVIEVGVDVPNATLMVVENADRFGLSQLHQLRGRVGRGAAQAYCVLFTANRNPETLARLKALCKTTDGFEIARADLNLRGPGDFFGTRQHGLPAFKVGNLSMDLKTLQDAQTAAAEFVSSEDLPRRPEYMPLMDRIRALFAEGGGIGG